MIALLAVVAMPVVALAASAVRVVAVVEGLDDETPLAL